MQTYHTFEFYNAEIAHVENKATERGLSSLLTVDLIRDTALSRESAVAPYAE